MAKAGSGYILQAGDGLLSDAVNTEFILDMQRKLYRWSAANPQICSILYATAERFFMLDDAWPVTGVATRRARIV